MGTQSHRTDDIRRFILHNVPSHPTDVVQKTMLKFKISRPAVHKHLSYLIHQNLIKKTGTTRNTLYELNQKGNRSWKIKVKANLQEHEVWEKTLAPELKDLPRNIHSICFYGFTEMMNNVIDHSKAAKVTVDLAFEGPIIKVTIRDDGVGIFKKMQTALGLHDIREAVLQLSKGKFTTDPKRHTGEGIFFTSRVFDEFAILSGGLEYICIWKDADWLIQSNESASTSGTTVTMEIDRHSKKELEKIFKDFTDSDYNFNKTDVFVKLVKLTGEKYISRSQAKRVLMGLEKFKKIALNFQEVSSVGQAFVDEVFRVYKNMHPEITIEYINANENIEFMIKRCRS